MLLIMSVLDLSQKSEKQFINHFSLKCQAQVDLTRSELWG